MSLSLWDIIVLAVVQGIAEFLPISSSGHLVIIARLLAPEGGRDLDIADLNIVLHGGTLMSILVYYWQRVWRLLGEDRRTIGLLIVGTIPAVILGLALKEYLEAILENPLLAGSLLLVTGTVLLWAVRRPPGDGRYQQMSYWTALKIGLIQAAAILPGLSRSGLTISSGLSQGLSRQDAATFSFLLAIPVISGACVLEGFDLASAEELHTPLIHLAIGALISFVVGLVALWWLVSWLEKGRLQYFAWWCYAVGIAVIIWQLSLPAWSQHPAPIDRPAATPALEQQEFDQWNSSPDAEALARFGPHQSACGLRSSAFPKPP